jgi:hypothetical protein
MVVMNVVARDKVSPVAANHSSLPHLAVEEDLVMPCYRVHGPKEGQGKPEIVDGDHVMLLNKFPLLRQHLLIVTRAFRPQAAPMDADNVGALWLA